MTMLAFHGKTEIKAEYLARIAAHEAEDEIVHGIYWENGKGCAVGCTVHIEKGVHEAYETQLGVPRILARLEDRIFEGLPNGESKTFPRRFLEAIPVGADLSMVWPRFALWLMIGLVRHTKKDSEPWVAIHRVADLYRDLIGGRDVKQAEWFEVRGIAASASASASAAYDVATAYAADAASYAASAAYDAASCAAAYAAASCAASCAAAYAAAAATRSRAYAAQADKLIQLLREAPIGA